MALTEKGHNNWEAGLDRDAVTMLMDSAANLIVYLDKNALITFCNTQCKRVTGHECHYLIGRSWPDLFLSSDAQLESTVDFADWVKQHLHLPYEGSFSTRSGQIRIIHWTFLTLDHRHPDQPEVVAIGYDITEYQKATKELSRREARYRDIVEDQTEMICRCLPDTEITFVNEAYAAFFGTSPKAMVGHKFLEYLPVDLHQNIIDFLARLGTNRPVDGVVHYAQNTDGEKRWLSWTCRAILNNLDDITEYQSVGRDITELLETRKQLVESEKRFRELADLMPEGVFEIDLDGQITFANRILIERFEYTRDELNSGLNFRQNIIPEDIPLAEANLAHIINSGEIQDKEYTALTKTGKTFPILIYPGPVISDGRISGIRGLLIDITARKQAEQLQLALYRIANDAVITQNLDEFYAAVRKDLSLVIDTNNFFIALRDEDTDTLSLAYLADDYGPFTSTTVKKTFTSFVIKTGQPLLATEDTMRQMVESGEAEFIGTPPKVWLGAPLQTSSGILGAVVVQNYTNPTAYTEKDKEILQFVSGQIASAIERKRAEESLRQAHHNLELRVRERTAELSETNRQLNVQIDHRIQAEEALRESDRRYDLATSAGRVGVWDWNLATNEMFVDPRLKVILGYKPEELDSTFEQFIQLLHPNDVDLVMEAGEAHLAGEADIYECEHRLMHKDGRAIWVLARGTAFRDARGKPSRLIGTQIDITDRKRAEKILKQTADELHRERKKLTEKNIALKQILDHIESSRKKYKEQIMNRVREAMLPLLNHSMDTENQDLICDLEAVKDNLFNLVETKAVVENDRLATLTPRESEICRLIKNGLSSKQMSERLNLSVVTVHKHRERIRKKLGLTNKSVNLSSYLRSQ
ncbi:MAG: PAS domain S-box protein [FCB group bacterium]|nr:PAS domain S-box protein [FCB group bacterium]